MGVSKSCRMGTRTPSTARTRLSSRTAESEWPPASKKPWSTPIRGMPRTSAKSSHRIAWRGVRGGRGAAGAGPSGLCPTAGAARWPVSRARSSALITSVAEGIRSGCAARSVSSRVKRVRSSATASRSKRSGWWSRLKEKRGPGIATRASG
ncbi:hypothetical protein SBADM41S_11742 [Streptomyces badius]